MKQIDDKKIYEQNAALEEEMKKEREEWNNKMQELIYMLKDNKKLAESQVFQLSYRQQAQERIAIYKNLKEKAQAKLDAQTTARFREYTISYDIKLSSTEKMAFVNTDTASLKQRVSLVQTQIEYFLECTKTLDAFGFAVKNKIEMIVQMI